MTRDHVSINRDVWNADAPNWVRAGREAWASETQQWGNWQEPEENLRLLPEDMTGMEAVELGCGTGYVSAWMARRGAKVTGIDVSAQQLATARELLAEHGPSFAHPITFIEGNAEATGLPDASFDFAISEYGAAIWCPPEVWLAEAHRLLRPGGRLVFLGNHPLSLLAAPISGADAERILHRPYRGMWGADWTTVEIDPSGIEFNLTMADWFKVFAQTGFAVRNYQEIYAPEGAEGSRGAVPADWARVYPAEQVWHLEKSV